MIFAVVPWSMDISCSKLSEQSASDWQPQYSLAAGRGHVACTRERRQIATAQFRRRAVASASAVAVI